MRVAGFLRSFLAVPVLVLLGEGGASAQAVSATLPTGAGARGVAVNPATNKIYVVNESSNDVTIIDGATHATARLPVGPRPQYIAVNPNTNRVYVSNGGNATQTVIDGATLATTTLPTSGNGPFVVNAATNKIYMLRLGPTDEVTIIDGLTHNWYSIATDSWTPVSHDVNAVTNKLFVAHYTTGDVKIVDISSSSDFPPVKGVPVWSKPVAVAVNPNTNKAYAITEDARGPINVIDGATQTAVSFAPSGHASGPRAIAVNAAANKIYAAFNGEVVVIDGATNALTFVPTVTAVALAVDPNANRIYVAGAQGALSVIDGATNAVTTVAIPSGATAIGLNSHTHKVYVASGSGVTVIDGAGTASAPPAAIPAAFNVQGLWWRAPQGSESGWGVNLTQQGETLFATWFTYDGQGNGLWLVMSSGTRTVANTYGGTLYQTTGPGFNEVPFDAAKVARAPVGSATFAFSDADNGMFSYTVNGVSGTKPITRQLYASPLPTCTAGGASSAAPNYQALWWGAPAGSESGWGLNVTHQGDILFVTWFTYAPDGKGMWLVGSNLSRTGNGSYAGTLYRAIGPPWNAANWNPAMVARSPAGSASLTFRNADNGVFSYSVNGITGSKAVTRQVYASPVTVCR
jgi:YVTN family beta-propeller protein